ncbi:MAG: methylmalonyl-CoA mutase [candidate division Zixibacteria bacterium]|nr:methylmalonyl-CoA mutase [candidate division Zixibacteria bacterium]
MAQRIRVLLAKPGLDGHDRGIKVIAAALRDAGMEVIYTGLRQTPDMVVEAAIQEDVDFVGMSILSGAHMTLFPEVLNLLKEKGAENIHLFGGGIIPDKEAKQLEEQGVGRLFGPGTSTEDIVKYIKSVASERSAEAMM